MTSAIPEGYRAFIQKQLPALDSAFFEALQKKPSTSIRVNPGKLAYPDANTVPWHKHGHYLNERPQFTADPLFHAGAYYPQEASSMFIEFAARQLLKTSASPVVADLCAAPGGKSIGLLEAMEGRGILFSNEVDRKRANALRENLTKWGRANFVVSSTPVEQYRILNGQCDMVLVDAPCSGEGMFRKEQKAVEQWNERLVASCAFTQTRILNAALELVKPNGYLVYSTCTYNKTENEGQIQKLLDTGHFEPAALNPPVEWGVHSDPELGSHRFFPHLTQGEGLFVGILKKKSGAPPQMRPGPGRFQKSAPIDWTGAKERDLFLQNGEEINHLKNGKVIEHWPISKLNPVQTGIPVAIKKKKLLLPHSLLPFNRHFVRDAFPAVSLNYNESLNYLLKDPVNPDLFKGRGWNCVVFNNVPLGLVKVIPNRVNNYFPKLWRIKMDRGQIRPFSLSGLTN